MSVSLHSNQSPQAEPLPSLALDLSNPNQVLFKASKLMESPPSSPAIGGKKHRAVSESAEKIQSKINQENIFDFKLDYSLLKHPLSPKAEKKAEDSSTYQVDLKFNEACKEYVRDKFYKKKGTDLEGNVLRMMKIDFEREKELFAEKDESLSVLEKGKRKIEKFKALKDAWEEFKKVGSFTPEELTIIENEIATCERGISSRSKANQKLKLGSVSSNSELPPYSPLKFSCMAYEMKIESEEASGLLSPILTNKEKKKEKQAFFKADKKCRSSQEWFQKYPNGKQLKSQLKERIRNQIQQTIRNYKPEEPTKPQGIKRRISQLAEQQRVTELLLKAKAGSPAVEIIDEMIPLIELLPKKFPDDERISLFYKVYAYDQAAAVKFYKGKTESAEKDIQPLYKYSSHNKKKIGITIEVSHQLHIYLSELATYLENKLWDIQFKADEKAEAKEVVKSEDLLEGFSSIEELIIKVSDYFINLIQHHKSLSYQRFNDLFTIHKNFLNRLAFTLSLVKSSDLETIKKVVNQALNSEILLRETTKHRNVMGMHKKFDSIDMDPNKKTAHLFVKKFHAAIEILTKANAHITDETNFKLYESAHVVPYPGLFVRKDKDDLPKEMMPTYYFDSVSEKYLSASSTEQESIIKKDIVDLHERYKDTPEKFLNESVEILMKIALQESSKTIHIPGIFNQFVDGASEKYVDFLPRLHDPLQTMREDFSTDDRQKKENDPTIHTKKAYKYILAHDFNKMVNDQLDAKEKNKEVTFSQTEVLQNEKDYLHAVKLSLANQLNQLAATPPTITSLIMACSLCNVFYAIKNAEALADDSKPLDLQEGEEEVLKSIKNIELWLNKVH